MPAHIMMERPHHEIAGGGAKSLKEVIGSHENNYTLIRLILASSVIYFHSFPLTKAEGYVDHLSTILLPITGVGGLAVKLFFFLSGLFVTQSSVATPVCSGMRSSASSAFGPVISSA